MGHTMARPLYSRTQPCWQVAADTGSNGPFGGLVSCQPSFMVEIRLRPHASLGDLEKTLRGQANESDNVVSSFVDLHLKDGLDRYLGWVDGAWRMLGWGATSRVPSLSNYSTRATTRLCARWMATRRG